MKIRVPLKQALASLNEIIKTGTDLGPHLSSWGSFDEDSISRRKADWSIRAFQVVETIFEDSEPLFRFSELAQEPSTPSSYAEVISGKDSLEAEKIFRYRLGLLAEFYREIEKKCVVPIEYVDSMSCLRFKDKVVELVPSSFERELCRYMFREYDFGQLIELQDVAKGLFYDEEDQSKEDLKERGVRIQTAASEVNRKTNSVFGFPVYRLPKNEIGLIHNSS